MSAVQTNLWWRADFICTPLTESRDLFVKQLGANSIEWSYVEWRPGSNLEDHHQAPILIQGVPEHRAEIELDEVRLFTATGGLHAIANGERTRWMQWQIKKPPTAEDNDPWHEEYVSVEESYAIRMLDREGARRFGLKEDELPSLEEMWITEYRRGGELFCWNLTQGGGDGQEI